LGAEAGVVEEADEGGPDGGGSGCAAAATETAIDVDLIVVRVTNGI
jgi:hypothetical protein